MMYATHCKFCKRPITVQVDDEYASLGEDPLKLLPLAACDHCADVRVERWGLEEAIRKASERVHWEGNLNQKGREDERKAHYDGLASLTKRYARMISRWHFLEGECWDEGVVEAILQQPRKWGSHVGRLWRMFRDWQRQQEQQERMKI